MPALAIFALPGGVVLLPLAAKILPFDLLPGALSGKSRTFSLSHAPLLIDAVLF